MGLGLEVRQSESSRANSFGRAGGPISPRPLALPNLLAGGGASSVGLNLEPFDHTSSLSAAPEFSEPKPIDFFLMGVSGSGAAARIGRVDARQSLAPSDTLGSGSERGGARREESRDDDNSGRGPSRLQGLSNFPSSFPPKPERSLAG